MLLAVCVCAPNEVERSICMARTQTSKVGASFMAHNRLNGFNMFAEMENFLADRRTET